MIEQLEPLDPIESVNQRIAELDTIKKAGEMLVNKADQVESFVLVACIDGVFNYHIAGCQSTNIGMLEVMKKDMVDRYIEKIHEGEMEE